MTGGGNNTEQKNNKNKILQGLMRRRCLGKKCKLSHGSWNVDETDIDGLKPASNNFSYWVGKDEPDY